MFAISAYMGSSDRAKPFTRFPMDRQTILNRTPKPRPSNQSPGAPCSRFPRTWVLVIGRRPSNAFPSDPADNPTESKTAPSIKVGCPMFAISAYMGSSDRAKPFERFPVDRQTTLQEAKPRQASNPGAPCSRFPRTWVLVIGRSPSNAFYVDRPTTLRNQNRAKHQTRGPHVRDSRVHGFW